MFKWKVLLFLEEYYESKNWFENPYFSDFVFLYKSNKCIFNNVDILYITWIWSYYCWTDIKIKTRKFRDIAIWIVYFF